MMTMEATGKLETEGTETSHLVTLQYANNHCYTTILDAGETDVEIDEEEGTWSWLHWEDISIGSARSPYHRGHKVKEGPIGVYDRSDTGHLKRMVRDAKRFTKTDSPAVRRV